MSSRPSGLLGRVLLAALATAISAGSIAAQDTNGTPSATPSAPPQSNQTAAPAASHNFSSDEYQPMKFEGFLGYSWVAPNGHIGGLQLDRHIIPGGAISGAYFVNKYAGFEVLGSMHKDNDTLSSITAGPILRYPMAGLSPFAHATFGGNYLNVPGLKSSWGPGAALGGGLDLAIPSLSHFKIRLIQADYLWSHHNYSPIARPTLKSAQLSTGIVFTAVPITPPIPPTVACAVQPTEVYAGEPVNVTVTPSNFNPKRTVNYSYQSNGGKVAGTGATTTVDTTGANPGDYTLTSTATDGKMKLPVNCNGKFTVKEWPAPQVSCTANPTEIDPGQTAQINSTGSTVKGNLKYSYTASAGNVTGDGPNATLNATGANPGPINVTCTVTDDRGKTASAQTAVTVKAPVAPPPPPPPPEASKINEIAFTKPYSPRVDNTAKAILDDVALRLQREPDSKAVVIGETDPTETSKTRGKNLAALRAVNTKAYLVNEKGIDPSRIEARTDGTNGMKTEIWIVPAGATYNQPDTQVVNLPTPKPVVKGAHRRSGHKAATTKAPAA